LLECFSTRKRATFLFVSKWDSPKNAPREN
jgi:hypothetical protein